MLFPQKINTTAKHDTNGWMNLSVIMFLLGAFYCIQMNPLCKLYIMEELSRRN